MDTTISVTITQDGGGGGVIVGIFPLDTFFAVFLRNMTIYQWELQYGQLHVY